MPEIDAGAAEHPRLKRFRLKMVKEIPRFPNDKTTKKFMEAKHFQDVMIDYLSWKSRMVIPRRRQWFVSPMAFSDSRWNQLQAGLNRLKQAVEAGDDLKRFLSLEPRTKGVSPQGGWSDKDQVLNIMGFHHFHLGPASRQHRSDDLAFALVTRERFDVLAIFDHSVFETGTPERSRLHDLHMAVVTGGHGGFYVMTNVSASGHPTQLVRYAMQCGQLIERYNDRLDTPGYFESEFKISRNDKVKGETYEWDLSTLDLRIIEKKRKVASILYKGWM